MQHREEKDKIVSEEDILYGCYLEVGVSMDADISLFVFVHVRVRKIVMEI